MVFQPPDDPSDDAITPPDPGVMFEGVPAHLAGPLREWINEALKEASWGRLDLNRRAKKLCLLLQVASKGDYPGAVAALPDVLLLKAIQIMLTQGIVSTSSLPELTRVLKLGHSVYEVYTPFVGRSRLRRRVDGFLRRLFDKATTSPNEQADKHLANAYAAAYDLLPDPNKAYAEAVRAVEAILCPLVLPKADKVRTLGTTIKALRDQLTAKNPKWSLAMSDANGPASLDKFIGMLELLWHGQQSRHAGSSNSRPQTTEEAMMAVTLATSIVHLVKVGLLVG